MKTPFLSFVLVSIAVLSLSGCQAIEDLTYGANLDCRATYEDRDLLNACQRGVSFGRQEMPTLTFSADDVQVHDAQLRSEGRCLESYGILQLPSRFACYKGLRFLSQRLENIRIQLRDLGQ